MADVADNAHEARSNRRAGRQAPVKAGQIRWTNREFARVQRSVAQANWALYGELRAYDWGLRERLDSGDMLKQKPAACEHCHDRDRDNHRRSRVRMKFPDAIERVVEPFDQHNRDQRQCS